MKTRFSGKNPLWVVYFIACSSVALSGNALASAAAGIGPGAIFGGFFTDNSEGAGVPEYPGALSSEAASPATGICEKAVAAASAGHQLPPGLLSAIATVESGRLDPRTGSAKPWPWTIDANGAGSMYDSEQSAIRAAASFEAAGITSLDIGCLQVNLAQHPDAFQNLAQAFDPKANADYAAGFLDSLEQKFGNWPQAVAAYHSQTPDLGQPYAAKVYANWQAAAGAALVAFANHGDPAMPNAMTPAVDMTSQAPPMAILMRPGKALTHRGLAAYRAAPVAIAANMAPQG